MNAVVCAPGLMKVSFVSSQSEEFHIYTQYCTNYPRYGLERGGVLPLFCFKSLDAVSGTVCLALCWRPREMQRCGERSVGISDIAWCLLAWEDPWSWSREKSWAMWNKTRNITAQLQRKINISVLLHRVSTSLLTFHCVCHIWKMCLCNITGKERSSGFAW